MGMAAGTTVTATAGTGGSVSQWDKLAGKTSEAPTREKCHLN